jgi:hypothetical protein
MEKIWESIMKVEQRREDIICKKRNKPENGARNWEYNR